MRIGLDFDNTIVCYDSLFYRVVSKRHLIPERVLPKKLAIRDYLRSVGLEDSWTEIQGYVYGPGISGARPFGGCVRILRQAIDSGVEFYIVSHKTRYPFKGPKYDLHNHAYDWISEHLRDAKGELFSSKNISFNEAKRDKILQIEKSQFDFFLDDLPEILGDPNFPTRTKRILFDPENLNSNNSFDLTISNWTSLASIWNSK